MTLSTGFNRKEQLERLSIISGVSAGDLESYLEGKEIRTFNNKCRDPVHHGLNFNPTGMAAALTFSTIINANSGNAYTAALTGSVALLLAATPYLVQNFNEGIKSEIVHLVDERKEQLRLNEIGQIAGMIGLQHES